MYRQWDLQCTEKIRGDYPPLFLWLQLSLFWHWWQGNRVRGRLSVLAHGHCETVDLSLCIFNSSANDGNSLIGTVCPQREEVSSKLCKFLYTSHSFMVFKSLPLIALSWLWQHVICSGLRNRVWWEDAFLKVSWENFVIRGVIIIFLWSNQMNLSGQSSLYI